MYLPLLLVSLLHAPSVEHGLIVRVDSVHRTVTLIGGKYDIAAGMEDMPGMPMGMMQMQGSSLLKFTWPVTGWIRGVRLNITDANGRALSRRLVHHINVINFGRRQLFYDIPERMIAMGEETEDIRVPATVGMPVTAGMPMAALVMWHNHSQNAINGVSFEMTIEYSPQNLVPRPKDILPVYLDVMNPVGRDVDFDLPPGPSRWSRDFVMPVTGRIVGAGGHAHDYATSLRLLDVTDSTHPRSVVNLKLNRDAKGGMISIERQLPGITGDGIKLEAGRRYRLEGTYDNQTGHSLEKGGMLHMALLYAPEKADQWPETDVNSRDYVTDMKRLKEMGEKQQQK